MRDPLPRPHPTHAPRQRPEHQACFHVFLGTAKPVSSLLAGTQFFRLECRLEEAKASLSWPVRSSCEQPPDIMTLEATRGTRGRRWSLGPETCLEERCALIRRPTRTRVSRNKLPSSLSHCTLSDLFVVAVRNSCSLTMCQILPPSRIYVGKKSYL